jgi:tetratricopeptide (TPR) repeat protein
MPETVEKQVLPEVQRYIEARAAYQTKLRKLRDVSNDLYYERHTSDEAMKAYQAAVTAFRTADNAQDDHFDALAATLAGETDDKLVKFVAENYLSEYAQQAIIILEKLPASFKELDQLADDEGWCGVWAEAVDAAAKAGVIDFSPVESTTRKLTRFLNCEMGKYDANKAMTMVEEIVELRIKEELAKRIEKALDASDGVSE